MSRQDRMTQKGLEETKNNKQTNKSLEGQEAGFESGALKPEF